MATATASLVDLRSVGTRADARSALDKAVDHALESVIELQRATRLFRAAGDEHTAKEIEQGPLLRAQRELVGKDSGSLCQLAGKAHRP